MQNKSSQRKKLHLKI